MNKAYAVSRAEPSSPRRRMLERLRARVRARPEQALVFVAAAALVGYVLVYPFTLVHYPPMVDLPFHAASCSILRHYFDPSYRFHEQFELAFLKVPYWTHYALGALFAFVLPMRSAVKLATVICLAALPFGLGSLARGLKKSPYIGLYGLVLDWCLLVHWGFLNHMAALGFSAAALGFAFMILERPTRARQLGLALSLLLVLESHVFRYPFAVASVLAAALVLAPLTHNAKELRWPLVPSALVFLLWGISRDPLGGPKTNWDLALHWDRFAQVESSLFGAFYGHEEQDLARRAFGILLIAGFVGFALAGLARRHANRLERGVRSDGTHAASSSDLDESERRFRARASCVVLGLALLYLALYLVLPMQIGIWWYVYPREIVSALFIALALMPDVPRRAWLKAPWLAAVALAVIPQAALVCRSYARFENETLDFRDAIARIPQAPRLGYMMLDLGGSDFRITPFVHLPAWVQAEKGGSLSFHMVTFNQSPIKYRSGSAEVPPPTPLRFEWMQGNFDVGTRGRFFDWFLVRALSSPDRRFAVDPQIQRVFHEGTFWLYRRVGVEPR